MTINEDRASDKRLAITFGGLMALEIFLGVLADSGTIGLVWWLILSVTAVLAVAALSARLQRRLR